MVSIKNSIIINAEFSLDFDDLLIEDVFQNFRISIFNALFEQYIPIEQQELVIEQLLKENLLK